VGSIAIVGLGQDSYAFAADAIERLRRADRVVIPSQEGRVASALDSAGIPATPLSELGLALDMPVDRLIEGLVELSREGDVAYATAGYPFLKEGLLAGLLSRSGESLDVYSSPSPLQVILMAFDIDLTADLDIVDAGSFAPAPKQRDSHLIVTGVRNPVLARKVAERLGELYPADHYVIAAGSAAEAGFALSLHTVQGLGGAELGENAALYVAPSRLPAPEGFAELVRLIAVLRGPDGCPWDRVQDHMSLRRHMLEEAYEAVAAIEAGGDAELADELGDVLLQVVLHAQIATDEARFTIDDVIARIVTKIRRRHPHVFADAVAETPAEVHKHWDEIKRGEKTAEGLLDGVPSSLPALMRAQKISRRVVGVGFEWESLDDVWEKLHEEIDELKAVEPGSPQAADEIGDVLFTMVNIARKQGIDAEEALRGTCEKFARRWRSMEQQAAEDGQSIADLGIEELESLWQEAKRAERPVGDASAAREEIGEEGR